MRSSAFNCEVYVVNAQTRLHYDLIPKSALIGNLGLEERSEVRLIYCEGNKADACNLNRYVEKVYTAWERAATGYPTSAKLAIPAVELIRIGTYYCAQKRILVEDIDILSRWLDTPVVDPRELVL